MGLYERGGLPQSVGGIILALTILLWVLLSFPAAPAGVRCRPSTIATPARSAHAMAVFFAPLGFNWRICIALIPGLAA